MICAPGTRSVATACRWNIRKAPPCSGGEVVSGLAELAAAAETRLGLGEDADYGAAVSAGSAKDGDAGAAASAATQSKSAKPWRAAQLVRKVSQSVKKSS